MPFMCVISGRVCLLMISMRSETALYGLRNTMTQASHIPLSGTDAGRGHGCHKEMANALSHQEDDDGICGATGSWETAALIGA